jgi:nitrite reductase/ring-hydroxylating ferredoxin subunit
MLVEGRPAVATVGDVDIMLLRRDGAIHAIGNHCCHRGGPLNEGEIVDGCVECPWHGSRFRLEDGSVRRGPAAYPQPVYEARESDGRIEVRAAG